MAGSMKDIKLRIKSVESTMQITKAMELVASSKMRRARDRVERSRPYFEVLSHTLSDIAASNTDFQSPFLKKRELKKTLLIVIAGDRGLAGGYNSNILKLAAEEKGEIVYLPIGKRSFEYYSHHDLDVFSDKYTIAADISVGDCFEISRQVADAYLKGEFDAVKICYTRFISMLTQTPATQSILPLTLEKEPEEEKTAQSRALILYEPNSEEVFNAIIPEYIAGIIYGALSESIASEQAARRTAMDAATKNASEMIENLNLYYNRARQGAITQEITEIVAGAEN